MPSRSCHRPLAVFLRTVPLRFGIAVAMRPANRKRLDRGKRRASSSSAPHAMLGMLRRPCAGDRDHMLALMKARRSTVRRRSFPCQRPARGSRQRRCVRRKVGSTNRRLTGTEGRPPFQRMRLVVRSDLPTGEGDKRRAKLRCSLHSQVPGNAPQANIPTAPPSPDGWRSHAQARTARSRNSRSRGSFPLQSLRDFGNLRQGVRVAQCT